MIKASLFATCLGDNFFAEACADTVRLLRHFGVEVDFPERQTCCGQPAFNAGHRRDAVRMARHAENVFSESQYVVLPSGSCASMVRSHYPELLSDGPHPLAPPAHSTDGVSPRPEATERVWELSQFLVHVLGVDSIGSGLQGTTVAYHHGCHALRELGAEHEPVTLLRGAGASVLDWEADRECCGFGGLFSAKMPEVSAAMADRKLETLPEVDVVTSTDGGCLLQMSGRAERRGDAPPFQHIASLLWRGVGG